MAGATGFIHDMEIDPISSEALPSYADLGPYQSAGEQAMRQTVMITLNGGLGTSMGLMGPKSLLQVKNGKSFLEIILGQANNCQADLALMNSFSTQADTVAAIAALKPPRPPFMFLQHKFPKILRDDLTPARWPSNPTLEWNPPGHGDVFTALHTSGMLDRLLAKEICFAFISNSDNLGAAMDPLLLGYFAQQGYPFMMEVCEKTPADIKGGHLARYRVDGRLVLREAAQCPPGELAAFQDIDRYRFFNTNNIWVNLRFLKQLIEKEKSVRLPIIVNPKTLDPRAPESPPVLQIETAMGAAISLFDGASAVKVPRTRFFPVKKSNDLLAVRSDWFVLTPDARLIPNPERISDTITIRLDPDHYGKIDDFEAHFGQGAPSLKQCTALTVHGDVYFEKNVTISGAVTIQQTGQQPAVIPANTVIDQDLSL